MKTVLFVPGFMEDLNSRDYKKTIKVIEEKGYKVKFVPIKWKRTTINDWVEELEKEYIKYDSKNVVLAGFSFGSITAFMSATERNPSELWLFSLSPYFSDDMSKMKKLWLKYIGKHRDVAFSKLNFNKLAQKIKCKTLIFVGEAEAKKYPLLDKRTKMANKKIKNSRVIIVPNCKHDVADERYITSIQKNI
jgi:predicted alpha/beta hydrolase family esterase